MDFTDNYTAVKMTIFSIGYEAHQKYLNIHAMFEKIKYEPLSGANFFENEIPWNSYFHAGAKNQGTKLCCIRCYYYSEVQNNEFVKSCEIVKSTTEERQQR